MKISFLLPHIRISGGVKALLEYANRLYNRGHQTAIFFLKKQPKWYKLGQRMRLTPLINREAHQESIDWFSNRVPIYQVPKFLDQYLPDADVLVVSSWETAEVGVNLSPSKGRKFYFVQHYESLWAKQKRKADATYRKPFCKIVISSWLQQILKYKFDQDSHLLVTPVDRKQFYCDQKTWNEPPKICLLHHNYDWKGYAEGINAIRHLKEKKIEFKLTVFGEKLKDPDLLFKSAGFNFEYHYRPVGESLRKIYSVSDIYLCPSWYEGLGMPSMEAMACRCALVTADTGGSRDYAIHQKTALVSPMRDFATLTKNLISAVKNVSLRRKLSESGYQKILEFKWDTNIDRLEKWFSI